LYNLTAHLGSMLEVSYAGQEYALREGNPYFQRLPEHVLVNFWFEYITDITGGAKLELSIRVNNLFDKLYYSQWGLPEAGRSFVIGGALEL
jgi:outer membrane cobalamin receptor